MVFVSHFSTIPSRLIVPPDQGGSLGGSSSRLIWDRDGNYTVIGSASDDRIRIYEENLPPGRITTPEQANRWLTVEVNGDKYQIPLNGQLQPPARSVTLRTGVGQDSVTVQPGIDVPVHILSDHSVQGRRPPPPSRGSQQITRQREVGRAQLVGWRWGEGILRQLLRGFRQPGVKRTS